MCVRVAAKRTTKRSHHVLVFVKPIFLSFTNLSVNIIFKPTTATIKTPSCLFLFLKGNTKKKVYAAFLGLFRFLDDIKSIVCHFSYHSFCVPKIVVSDVVRMKCGLFARILCMFWVKMIFFPSPLLLVLFREILDCVEQKKKSISKLILRRFASSFLFTFLLFYMFTFTFDMHLSYCHNQFWGSNFCRKQFVETVAVVVVVAVIGPNTFHLSPRRQKKGQIFVHFIKLKEVHYFLSTTIFLYSTHIFFLLLRRVFLMFQWQSLIVRRQTLFLTIYSKRKKK